MIWDSRTVFTLWGYKPETKTAIKWHRRADGNWRGSDRGQIEDNYSAQVIFRGPESELIDLESVLDDNRFNFTATFKEGEEIFGADVDHTGPLGLVVTEYGKIRQADFKVFEMNLTLRNLSPEFITVTPDFTQLRTSSHQNTRETEFQITKLFAYDNSAFAVDHLSNDGTEPGIFTARFSQTKDEMPAIRQFLSVTARATKIPFPTFGGITKPFGNRAGSGPFDVRVIDWDDLGRQDFCDWNLSITFARELSRWNE